MSRSKQRTKRRSSFPNVPNAFPFRETAPRHIHWRTIKVYEGIYLTKKTKRSKNPPIRMKIKALEPLPPTRTFRTSKGERKFHLARQLETTRKVIYVMPTATKAKKTTKTAAKTKAAKAASTKSRKKAVEDEDEVDEELEGLEELDEELDDLEEDADDTTDTTDDTTDDEEDDEDEDEEEVAPPKSKKKDKKSKRKPPPSRKGPRDGKVGSQDVAEHLGVDARTLRMLLRKHGIEKDEETSRYEWDDLDHPDIRKMKKAVDKGEHTTAKKEQFDKLKEKSTSKKEKKNKKKKRKEEVEDDEDDE